MKLAVGVALLLGGCGSLDGVFDRPWTFTFVQGAVAAHQADGSSWDPDNSPADPYVALSLNNSQIGMTPTLDDNPDPFWSYSITSPDIHPGDTISINMNDSDTFVDDIIIGGCNFSLTETFEKMGGGECKDSLGSLTFTVAVD